MKMYVKSSDESLVQPKDLSKERLELIVSEIINIIDDPAINNSRQLMKILSILQYFKLKE